MHFLPNDIYHIYNRGNNKQKVFFNEENYYFFHRKMHLQLKPYCNILAWCLMPNHFHFVISTNEVSCASRANFGTNIVQELGYRIGILLSSYAQAINKQNKTSGSLFQSKTKSRLVTPNELKSEKTYLVNAIHYCHQNPWRAGLVRRIEDWPHSSFSDYCGLRDDDLCNKELLLSLTGYSRVNFYEDSYQRIEGFDLEE